jgi:enterochelin esterase family protein
MTTLLQRAQSEGTPLIDGSSATFLWKREGDVPVPQLVGDFTGWGAHPTELSELEPETWGATVSLPPDAYVEYSFRYKFDIIESLNDPFNPRLVFNGLDSVNNYFAMPQHQPNDLIRRKPGVRRGAVSEHWLETNTYMVDSHRKVWLYHPPVNAPTPLIVVWDGQDYLSRGRLNIIVDNLIAEGRIQPIALAFIESRPASRFIEYMQTEGSVGLLTTILLPFVSKHLNLIGVSAQAGIHGVLGSSMGGLMALYAGLRAPDVFGHVVCQSGAFWFEDPQHDMLVVDYVKRHPGLPIKIWQDVGTLEYLLAGNRKMNTVMVENGYDVTYREYPGGHNQTCWADNTWRGLEAVYGIG